MEVKIIEASDVWELERKVNKFLSYISENKIIDIKYQGGW